MISTLYLIINHEILQAVQECKVCHPELEEVDQISKEVTFSVVMVLQWVHQVVAPWAQRDKTCANVKTLKQNQCIRSNIYFYNSWSRKCNKVSTCYQVQLILHQVHITTITEACFSCSSLERNKNLEKCVYFMT